MKARGRLRRARLRRLERKMDVMANESFLGSPQGEARSLFNLFRAGRMNVGEILQMLSIGRRDEELLRANDGSMVDLLLKNRAQARKEFLTLVTLYVERLERRRVGTHGRNLQSRTVRGSR